MQVGSKFLIEKYTLNLFQRVFWAFKKNNLKTAERQKNRIAMGNGLFDVVGTR